MNYSSVLLAHFGRIFWRRNQYVRIGTIIAFLALALTIVAGATIVRSSGIGSPFLRTVLYVLTVTSAVTILTSSAPQSVWRIVLHRRVLGWLEIGNIVIGLAVIGFLLLVPYYSYRITSAEWRLAALQLVAVTSLTLSTIFLGAVAARASQTISPNRVMQLIISTLCTTAVVILAERIELLEVIHTTLTSNLSADSILVALGSIATLITTGALLDALHHYRRQRAVTKSYNQLFRVFRIFAAAMEPRTAQLLSAALLWVRTNAVWRRFFTLLGGYYLIGLTLVRYPETPVNLAVLAAGSLTAIGVASSTTHVRHGKSQVESSFAVWLAGTVIITLWLVVIATMLPIFSIEWYWIIGLVSIIVMTLTIASRDRQGASHSHDNNRVTLLLLAAGLIGAVPGLLAPTLTASQILLLVFFWLLGVLGLLRFRL